MCVFNKISIVICLTILAHRNCIAQDSSAVNYENMHHLKTKTDQLLGPDDLLVNGKTYLPANLHVTGSPEFNYDFKQGSALYIKGQTFNHIKLAYDIVSDELLLVQQFGNGLENRIALNPAYADSFLLGNRLFINLTNLSRGYFELVASGNISFLKKYSMEYVKIYDASNRGKYSEQKFTCYLYDNKTKLTPVYNKFSFLHYFKQNKKAIRNYLHTNKINLKKSGNSELSALMKYCNSFPNEEN
jgi:hypothetical protein